MRRKYVISTELITKPKQVDTKGANAVVFVNRGEADAIVNDERIETDQSISNSGLRDEEDETLYNIKFVNTGVQTQILYMRIKRYVP